MNRTLIIPALALLLILVGTWAARQLGVAATTAEATDASPVTGAAQHDVALSGGRTAVTTSAEPVVEGVRRAVAPARVRVVDGATGRPIDGAELTLFDGMDDRVGRAHTTAEGYAELPRGLEFCGYGVTASGYQATAAEAAASTIPMVQPTPIRVAVRGVGARVAEDYELQASLEFGAQRYPTAFACRVATIAPVRVRLDGGQCLLPRPLRAPGVVLLHGVHRGSGKVTKFDSQEIGADQHHVEFDCSGYAEPTGNWLRVEVLAPEAECEVVRLSVDLQYQVGKDRWERWGDPGTAMLDRRGDRQARFDHLELAGRTYRLQIRFGSPVVGTHTTAAFAVKGRVVKRIDLRSQGRASITVRFLGASSAKHRAGYLGILGPRGPVTTLAEDLAPGVVRFLNLDPGTYNLRSYLGTALGFGATPVTVAAGGRAVVDVVLVPCGQLVLEGIDPKTGFAVHDSSTGRAIPTDLFYRRNDMSLIARIPQGTYRIEVADQPARDAVVGATETIVDFGVGRPK